MGVVSGIFLIELFRGILPKDMTSYYIDILAGTAVALLVSKKKIAGLCVVIYVISWKLLGAYYLTCGNRSLLNRTVMYWYSLDYAAVIIAAVIGGWIGILLNKLMDRNKSNKVP